MMIIIRWVEVGVKGVRITRSPSPGVCLLCITIIIIPTMHHHPSPQFTPVHLTTKYKCKLILLSFEKLINKKIKILFFKSGKLYNLFKFKCQALTQEHPVQPHTNAADNKQYFESYFWGPSLFARYYFTSGLLLFPIVPPFSPTIIISSRYHHHQP